MPKPKPESPTEPVTPQRQAILDLLGDDETVMFYEPETLDVAIIGLTCAQPGREACVVYDYAKVLACYRKQMGDDAEEWISFNTLGAYVGLGTPLVVTLTVPKPRRRARAERDRGPSRPVLD